MLIVWVQILISAQSLVQAVRKMNWSTHSQERKKRILTLSAQIEEYEDQSIGMCALSGLYSYAIVIGKVCA
jgi:hypothetical protein